jgi:hypothetical protein
MVSRRRQRKWRGGEIEVDGLKQEGAGRAREEGKGTRNGP